MFFTQNKLQCTVFSLSWQECTTSILGRKYDHIDTHITHIPVLSSCWCIHFGGKYLAWYVSDCITFIEKDMPWYWRIGVYSPGKIIWSTVHNSFSSLPFDLPFIWWKPLLSFVIIMVYTFYRWSYPKLSYVVIWHSITKIFFVSSPPPIILSGTYKWNTFPYSLKWTWVNIVWLYTIIVW